MLNLNWFAFALTPAANEVAEKLAVVGFSTNMLTYLTTQLHMPLAKAATTLTNFGGTSAATPLIGAFLADACIGRFWTIAAASVVYQVVRANRQAMHTAYIYIYTYACSLTFAQGMALLTVSAALPQFRPPPCKPGGAVTCQEAAPWQLAVLYVSLLLNAVGAGGYRPCIVAFGADQFDESRAAERARSWGFFNWYYFCNGASMLLAVTAVVYVQDNVGWGWGLGVPAFCMGVSVAAFVAGYPMYRRLDPAGSPFTRLAQVVVAAVRKRRLPAADVDPARLYQNDDLDAPISMYGKLLHTDQLRYVPLPASAAFALFFHWLHCRQPTIVADEHKKLPRKDHGQGRSNHKAMSSAAKNGHRAMSQKPARVGPPLFSERTSMIAVSVNCNCHSKFEFNHITPNLCFVHNLNSNSDTKKLVTLNLSSTDTVSRHAASLTARRSSPTATWSRQRTRTPASRRRPPSRTHGASAPCTAWRSSSR